MHFERTQLLFSGRFCYFVGKKIIELEKKRNTQLKPKAKKKKKPLGKVPSISDVSDWVNGGENAKESFLEENGLSDQEGEKEQQEQDTVERISMEGNYFVCTFSYTICPKIPQILFKEQKVPLWSANGTVDIIIFIVVQRAEINF